MFAYNRCMTKRTYKNLYSNRNTMIMEFYREGRSCQEIAEMANFGISVRQMQRILAKMGVTRSTGDAFRLAVKKGRVKYHRIPDHLKKQRKHITAKLRYQILKRDNFKCVLCGVTAQECRRLEVDHINENATDNNPSNLQTLCDRCNSGKTRHSTSRQPLDMPQKRSF